MPIPAAEPVEQRIIENVKTTLEAIAPANGNFYTTVSGVLMCEGNPADSQLSMPSIVCIYESAQEEYYEGAVGLMLCQLGFDIYAILPDGDTSQRDIKRFVADIKVALRTDPGRGTFASQANAFDTLVQSASVANESDGLTVAMARIGAHVIYRTPFTDPTVSQ